MTYRFFTFYQAALSRRPLLVQSGTAAGLYAIGDVLAQSTSVMYSTDPDNNEWDWNRTFLMTSIGGCALGPTMAIWYRFLQRSIQLKSHASSVALRVLIDQTTFAPASIAALYCLTELLQLTTTPMMRRLEIASKKIEDSFFTVLMSNYLLWPAVSYLNFFFVPLQYRLLISNTVAIFWSAFLSLTVNGSG